MGRREATIQTGETIMTVPKPLPKNVHLDENVQIGPQVIFVEGGDIRVGERVVIETACVIGQGVCIGSGAYLRAGSVVLRDVPANAVIEGNPAQIVGYRIANGASQGQTSLYDAKEFAGKDAPALIELGVGGSSFHRMRCITDPRGSLTVGEIEKELPFHPERYFMVFDVPSSELRGEHAHKQCAQFLLCVNGSCRVLLDDGNHRCEVTLDRPDLAVYMPPMIWGTQYRYSTDAVLLVFASRAYEAEDYIRSYDEFQGLITRS